MKLIILIGAAICFGVTIWFEADLYHDILILERELKVHFKQINCYKRLALIAKKSKKSTENPPKR